ncbi:radical SAM protein [Hyperthermus butylicus]|uniref:Fe-S oxidoreductase n=1 Tax=Hyperthermus butylicus (strain DSM 5456 / JCM 9403 / PLM1-5) TaxID=415426 RepID=A2BL55_HYPBU|nr:radical SAM protein [Hyperthermus butylicus]ABM80716.1 putative Fe-S oxidoreductase [Hyperthermus butylicus DSM 5456]
MRIRGFDPVKLGLELEKRVAENSKRKYSRFRGSRFYGGSAVGDVVGCNLRCVFCWSGRARDDPTIGFWVTAHEAYRRLRGIARSRGYRIVRLSGGEPTIGWSHLTELLDYFSRERGLIFVLETNGIILGYDRSKACQLAEYRNLHVRVSIKACSAELFSKLTAAKPEAFNYQLYAVKNLADCGVDFHVAVFASFGNERCWANFVSRIAEFAGAEVVEGLEVEYMVLYPSVKRRLHALEKLGLKPRIYYEP